MKTYVVEVTVTTSEVWTVEADSIEEARDTFFIEGEIARADIESREVTRVMREVDSDE